MSDLDRLRSALAEATAIADKMSDPVTLLEHIDCQIAALQAQRAQIGGWAPAQPGDWAISRGIAQHRNVKGSDNWWSEADMAGWTPGPIPTTEMVAVFGPDWEQVVALVRVAASLDSSQRQAWYEAWSADYNADRKSWDAAWSKVIVYGGPGVAARRALWAFVVGGDRGGVAGTLARRSEVDRKHYDRLTRAWRQHIGPIHPDDEVLA
jgi:hypothetical protein